MGWRGDGLEEKGFRERGKMVNGTQEKVSDFSSNGYDLGTKEEIQLS